ncbi:MAG TPA: type II toxin-antitoxin system Phd/YefM family antitoxin [Octadecabacter sp.]|nr:type II toxin-antitoxin system Phd/YefM family antitoxin [Octadecabacter sp.]
MTRVTATEFKNNIDAFSKAAMNEPVIITSDHRDHLVLVSAEEYQRLTGVAEDLAPSMEDRIKRTLGKHHDTIMELAKR